MTFEPIYNANMISRSLVIACTVCIMSVSICFAVNAWVIRPNGIGPVKIGMSLSQLNAVLHERFTLPEDKEERQCFYVNPSKPPDIGFMIEDGRVARVDIDGRNIATTEGVRVGDSEARAIQVYGKKLKVEPHAYSAPEGHYLTIRSSDGLNGIRFETDEGKIVRYYAGRLSAIEYIEGCE